MNAMRKIHHFPLLRNLAPLQLMMLKLIKKLNSKIVDEHAKTLIKFIPSSGGLSVLWDQYVTLSTVGSSVYG